MTNIGQYYLNLSRKRRKLAYINIKNEIVRTSSRLGGKFYTHHDIIHGVQWADIYFLSSRKPLIFYNAELVTTGYYISEESYNKALDESISIRDYPLPTFEPAGNGFSRMIFDPTEGEPQVEFGNLTRKEWTANRQREMLKNGEIEVRESIELDYEYAYGVGLHVVVDVPVLNLETITDFIQRFRDGGEKEYVGEPIDYDRDGIIGLWMMTNRVVDH